MIKRNFHTIIINENRTHEGISIPPAAPSCFFSLTRLLRAETSACSVSTRRSLSSTSLHAFYPTPNTENVWVKQQEGKTHSSKQFPLLLTCSSDCRESFILFTSLTSLSSPLEEKNFDLQQEQKMRVTAAAGDRWDVNCVQDHTRVSSWWRYNPLQSTEPTPSSTPAVPVNPGC